MKNTKFIILFAAVILVVGGIYLYSQQAAPQIDPSANSGQDVMMKDEAMMEKDDQSDAMMMAKEKYVPYSTEVFEGSANKRRVLFFYASWCPVCVPADKNFQENVAQIPEDVVLIRVNYNDPETDAEEKALAEKYGITYQHTFVEIDEQGNEVAKWNGGQIDELLSNLQ